MQSKYSLKIIRNPNNFLPPPLSSISPASQIMVSIVITSPALVRRPTTSLSNPLARTSPKAQDFLLQERELGEGSFSVASVLSIE